MDPQALEEPQVQGEFKQVYEYLKPTVWVVKVDGKLKHKPHSVSFTAFAVTKEGHLMSCGHGEWHKWSRKKIMVRRLDVNGEFKLEARLLKSKREAEIRLYKILVDCDFKEDEVVRFGSGILSVGDTIMSIGHPHECTGLGMGGRVNFDCVEDTKYELVDDQTCETYVANTLTHTPSFMIFGHILNRNYFRRKPSSDYKFEKNLQANLPIIQASGLIGGKGASGAPIFNLRKELVGMFTSSVHRFEYGVHVSALRKFLDSILNSGNEARSASGNQAPREEKNEAVGDEGKK